MDNGTSSLDLPHLFCFVCRTPAVSRANSQSEARAEAIGVGSSAWLGWVATPQPCQAVGVYSLRAGDAASNSVRHSSS